MIVYIWREVLTDYTDGIIVAVADSLDEAKRITLAVTPESDRHAVAAAMESKAPEERMPPYGAWVYGGG